MNGRIIAGALALSAFLTLNSLAQEKAPMAPTNVPPWEGSVALGLTVTRGNSETILGTASALAQKKMPKYEITLGANGSYGETTDQDTDETDQTAGSIQGYGQYNYLFTDRFYGYARLEALHDAVAEIRYRFTFSPGVGYYFIKDPRTRLSGEFGPGLVHERVTNEREGPNQPSDDETDTYITVRFAERFEHKFNDAVKMWQSAEFLPQVDRFHNYLLNVEVGVEAALSKRLSFRTVAVDNYDNVPAEGRKKNDIKVISSLVYKF